MYEIPSFYYDYSTNTCATVEDAVESRRIGVSEWVREKYQSVHSAYELHLGVRGLLSQAEIDVQNAFLSDLRSQELAIRASVQAIADGPGTDEDKILAIGQIVRPS